MRPRSMGLLRFAESKLAEQRGTGCYEWVGSQRDLQEDIYTTLSQPFRFG